MSSISTNTDRIRNGKVLFTARHNHRYRGFTVTGVDDSAAKKTNIGPVHTDAPRPLSVQFTWRQTTKITQNADVRAHCVPSGTILAVRQDVRQK